MQCIQCKTNFEPTHQQKGLFARLQVPPPKRCPRCRFLLLLQFRNERTLYPRTCALCKKSVVACISPGEPHTIYCRDCYLSDKWDPFTYGRDYDAKRPFIDQLHNLIVAVPQPATFIDGDNVNSEYTNFAGYNKNCYLTFNAGYNEDCLYVRGITKCQQVIDTYFGQEMELSYEIVNGKNNYGVAFADHTYDSRDSWFMYDCRNCMDCFGCVNLRNKKFCFYNEQLSKEAYEARILAIKGSFHAIEEHRTKFADFVRAQPVAAHHNFRSEQTTGDYNTSSVDCESCFETFSSERGSFLHFTKYTKDSSDLVGHGYYSEMLYYNVATGHAFNCQYNWYIDQGRDCQYCFFVSGENLFGCVGLKKGEYSILNKKYSKDEYAALRQKIIEDMTRDGSYGEYLPAALSPFTHNETLAHEFFPMTKEQAAAEGLRWRDDIGGIYGKGTLAASEIPDHIKDVQDTILKEMLTCIACNRNYKVVKQELEFYRKLMLPIPRKCFNCRHLDRVRRRGPFVLTDRTCGKCREKIKTIYAESQFPVVYCEQCYTESFV